MVDKTKTALDLLRKSELQELCRKHSLSPKGTNEQLRTRIREWANETGTQLEVRCNWIRTFQVVSLLVCLLIKCYKQGGRQVTEILTESGNC